MMTPDQRDEALAAAARLEESMGDLASEMQAMRQYGHRSRRLIGLLGVSLCFDLLLSVVLGVVAYQAHQATTTSAQNKQNARITCEAANQSRAAQIQLWGYVLDVSEQNPERTPQQRVQITQFRVYVARVFAQRDCNR